DQRLGCGASRLGAAVDEEHRLAVDVEAVGVGGVMGADVGEVTCDLGHSAGYRRFVVERPAEGRPVGGLAKACHAAVGLRALAPPGGDLRLQVAVLALGYLR